jgi:Fe/S biogenesis protein NfuA
MDSDTNLNEQQPAVAFTPEAIGKLNNVLAAQGRPVAGLRLQIAGRSGGEFEHVLSIEPRGARSETELVVEADGLRVFIDARTARYANGIRIHFEDRGPNVSGLLFLNPNPLWLDEREIQIQDIFDNHINPAIASHGGWVALLAVEGTTAYVQLGGGCQGCGQADVTLKQGIAATILEQVEGIERVVDETDHASGENPYYKPAKK